jgi:uncharacterized protein YebE (UPF0316 family)
MINALLVVLKIYVMNVPLISIYTMEFAKTIVLKAFTSIPATSAKNVRLKIVKNAVLQILKHV